MLQCSRMLAIMHETQKGENNGMLAIISRAGRSTCYKYECLTVQGTRLVEQREVKDEGQVEPGRGGERVESGFKKSRE